MTVRPSSACGLRRSSINATADRRGDFCLNARCPTNFASVAGRSAGRFAGLPPDPTQALAAGIVSETTVIEVMEARLCIEPALAGICATRALPDDVVRRRGLAQRIGTASDVDSRELWDSALHRLIARTAGNKPLRSAFSLLDNIRSNPTWRGLRSRARSAGMLKVSEREHYALIDAIEASDAQAAEARMHDHLTTIAANLRRILSAPAPPAPPPPSPPLP